MSRWLFIILISILGAGALDAQDYVGRYDVYGGFTYLDSSNIDLSQRGFHLQTGFRPRRWLSLGFDYSISTGHTDLSASSLTPQLQQQLGAQLAALAAAGQIPPGYSLSVPFDATTQTFAAGPQLDLHRFHKVTLFIRPSIGAIHELATLHPTDPIASAIAAQLAPSGQKTDWTGFYGFGGGATLRVTDHVGIRLQADFVHNHLFSDLLKDGRNTVRLSIGPAFQFGHNVQ
jgi:hypothetical protein